MSTVVDISGLMVMLTSKAASLPYLYSARQRRPHYTLFVTYDDKKIPEAPVQEALDKLAQKVREKRHVEDIKKVKKYYFLIGLFDVEKMIVKIKKRIFWCIARSGV